MLLFCVHCLFESLSFCVKFDEISIFEVDATHAISC